MHDSIFELSFITCIILTEYLPAVSIEDPVVKLTFSDEVISVDFDRPTYSMQLLRNSIVNTFSHQSLVTPLVSRCWIIVY